MILTATSAVAPLTDQLPPSSSAPVQREGFNLKRRRDGDHVPTQTQAQSENGVASPRGVGLCDGSDRPTSCEKAGPATGRVEAAGDARERGSPDLVQVKFRVLRGAKGDFGRTLAWMKHMAANPLSPLLDCVDAHQEVRCAKEHLESLRGSRQEDLLGRRPGLRRATLRSLELIPITTFSLRDSGAAAGEEEYPVKSSRVGREFQATLPEMARQGAMDGEREEPSRAWPLKELEGAGGRVEDHAGDPGGPTKRIAELLMDPVDYRWSDAEYRSFKTALGVHGEDFERISKTVRDTVEGSTKTTRQCVAFFFQVYEVEAGGRGEGASEG